MTLQCADGVKTCCCSWQQWASSFFKRERSCSRSVSNSASCSSTLASIRRALFLSSSTSFLRAWQASFSYVIKSWFTLLKGAIYKALSIIPGSSNTKWDGGKPFSIWQPGEINQLYRFFRKLPSQLWTQIHQFYCGVSTNHHISMWVSPIIADPHGKHKVTMCFEKSWTNWLYH